MKTVRAIGEFRLIDQIARGVTAPGDLIAGIGDDCAVLRHTAKKYLLVTTDTVCEDIHFTRKKASAYEIGRKALAVNISDIAACAGTPKFAFLALGIPPVLPADYFYRLNRGIRDLAKKFNITIAGGDTTRAPKIVITITLIGDVIKERLCLRRGARPGDLIYMTGAIGTDDTKHHLNFMPRVKTAQILTKHLDIHAMIDISDGLISDIGHILKASRTGAVINLADIPLRRSGQRLKEVLREGENFELVFTLSRRGADRLEKIKKRLLDVPVRCIGVITKNKYLLCREDGKKITPRQFEGYRHF